MIDLAVSPGRKETRWTSKDLKELLQILDDKEIAEFELEEEGMKLRIRKGRGRPPPRLPAGPSHRRPPAATARRRAGRARAGNVRPAAAAAAPAEAGDRAS